MLFTTVIETQPSSPAFSTHVFRVVLNSARTCFTDLRLRLRGLAFSGQAALRLSLFRFPPAAALQLLHAFIYLESLPDSLLPSPSQCRLHRETLFGTHTLWCNSPTKSRPPLLISVLSSHHPSFSTSSPVIPSLAPPVLQLRLFNSVINPWFVVPCRCSSSSFF